jgi:ribose 5-phosphate isomerase B
LVPQIHRVVNVGTDHAGFYFATRLCNRLSDQGYDVHYYGARAYDPDDDYPAPCYAAAYATATAAGSLGIVIGGSGNGEQMAANIVPGIRAALVWNDETALLARSHNDANVIAIGIRQISESEAHRLIDLFLTEPFSGELRHVRRIHQLAALENALRAGVCSQLGGINAELD